LGIALVAGSIRVPRPATGITAFFIFCIKVATYKYDGLPRRYASRNDVVGFPHRCVPRNDVGGLHIALKLLYFLSNYFMLSNFTL
jgi:hypothetical protein